MSAKILIVDDLQPNIKLLKAKLESEYYEVISATSGVQAIDMSLQFAPDIILLDVMMPEIDGFEACERIKANPKTAKIPIIMVTALGEINDRVQGLNAGADDFLTKPINDLALFARIRSLVRLKAMTDELQFRGQTGGDFGFFEEEGEIKVEDISSSKVLVVDDDAAQSRQINTKLCELGVTVDLIPDPAKAVKKSDTEDYDLVIINTNLEAADGLRLCSHFRSQEATRAIPLLIVIEESDTELLVRGLDMGINDYIVNPIDGNELIARARIQLRRKKFQDALKAVNKKKLSMAVTDGLTGLYNRRYFDSYIQRILDEAKGSEEKPIAVLMVDIDHFKMVNDTYGHASGDQVLKQLPQRLLDNIRPTDLAVRYGGEEFIVILPNAHATQAAQVGERIRAAVDEKKFAISAGQGELHCTVSIGIAVSTDTDTVATLLDRADKGLYHVKKTGRNKVAVYTEQPLD